MARFACPKCPERFDSIGDKKRHIREEHSSDRQKAKESR